MRRNLLEWVVFVVSASIIVVTVALLLFPQKRSQGRGPDLLVRLGEATRTSSGFAVPVTVTNDGDLTAEQALIEVVLRSESADVERAELTIAFLPHNSRREGWVVFQRDPRCCKLSGRAVAYQKP